MTIAETLKLLRSYRVSHASIEAIYGIPACGPSLARYDVWAMAHDAEHDAGVYRGAFERWLSRWGVEPIRLAAARLGVQGDALAKALERLEAKTSYNDHAHAAWPEVIDRNYIERAAYALSPHDRFGLQFGTLQVDAFLKALEDASEVQLQRLPCASCLAADHAPEFGIHLDALSGEPICRLHEHRLHTGNPGWVWRERCGTKTLALHAPALHNALIEAVASADLLADIRTIQKRAS